MSRSILVIDDDEAVRKAFKLALEDSEYSVDVADSGEEGVAKIREKVYDLVFLDMKMPGMNGSETLRELRDVNDGVPVYIVTAFHKEFLLDLQSLRRDGIKFDLLRKPLGAEEIAMLAKGMLKGPVEY